MALKRACRYITSAAKRAWRVTGITPVFRNLRVGTPWR
jgi:hypothetical protein